MHAISNKSKKLDIMTNGNKRRFPVFRCDVFAKNIYYAKMKILLEKAKNSKCFLCMLPRINPRKLVVLPSKIVDFLGCKTLRGSGPETVASVLEMLTTMVLFFSS